MGALRILGEYVGNITELFDDLEDFVWGGFYIGHVVAK